MIKKTERGRSVFHFAYAGKPVAASLSLLLVCAAAGTSFITHETVHAENDHKPLAAVAVTAEPLAAVAVTAPAQEKAEPASAASAKAEPLTAVAVTAQAAEAKQYEPLEATSLIPEVKRPDSYVNDYLGFTRTDLVSYLVENADEYLGTPYKEETVAPVPGKSGHMQCEGFIWDVMLAVATQNENDIPCGNIRTEPANGGGWVNWSYYHNVDPITFNTKEEMLASGILEKGDVIWSFDYAGPYGLSNSNHVGFFWGDDPHDDKFWESAEKTGTEVFAGSADGNRIAGIESMSKTPSVWWVFKLSPDTSYESEEWAGLPGTQAVSLPEEEETEEAENAGKEEKHSSGADLDEDAENMTAEEAPETGAAETAPENAESQSSRDSADGQNTGSVQEQNSKNGQNSGAPQENGAASDAAGVSQEEGTEQALYAEEDAAYEADVVSSSYESKSTSEMIFYNGQDLDTGYYSSFSTEEDPGYYGY